MPYKTVEALERLWNAFNDKITPLDDNWAEIQKLMTAKSVIDLSKHAIYVHMKYIHRVTRHLIALGQEYPDEYPDDDIVRQKSQLWTELLRLRNQHPLKIRHHRSLDGECSMHAALDMMEGKPTGFKEVTRLNPQNPEALQEALHRITQLGSLAHGTTFGELPGVGNVVLTSLLEHQDSICLLVRDQNDRIVGYSWGLMLRDFPVEGNMHANVFYIMDLARDPDYYDPAVKVGALLREHWANIIDQDPDCHFLAYQHTINHQFHMDIVEGRIPRENEQIVFAGKSYEARSGIEKDESSGRYIQYHFVRSHNNQLPFPGFGNLMSGIYRAFWRTAHSGLDFFSGATSFFGRSLYLSRHHDRLAKNPQKRICEPVTAAQQANDFQILKQIINVDGWRKQGRGVFSHCVPKTIQRLRAQNLNPDFTFEALKQEVANKGRSLMRSKMTAHFYKAVTRNHDPAAVLTMLVNNSETPKSWVRLISDLRQEFANGQTSLTDSSLLVGPSSSMT